MNAVPCAVCGEKIHLFDATKEKLKQKYGDKSVEHYHVECFERSVLA